MQFNFKNKNKPAYGIEKLAHRNFLTLKCFGMVLIHFNSASSFFSDQRQLFINKRETSQFE